MKYHSYIIHISTGRIEFFSHLLFGCGCGCCCCRCRCRCWERFNIIITTKNWKKEEIEILLCHFCVFFVLLVIHINLHYFPFLFVLFSLNFTIYLFIFYRNVKLAWFTYMYKTFWLKIYALHTRFGCIAMYNIIIYLIEFLYCKYGFFAFETFNYFYFVSSLLSFFLKISYIIYIFLSNLRCCDDRLSQVIYVQVRYIIRNLFSSFTFIYYLNRVSRNTSGYLTKCNNNAPIRKISIFHIPKIRMHLQMNVWRRTQTENCVTYTHLMPFNTTCEGEKFGLNKKKKQTKIFLVWFVCIFSLFDFFFFFNFGWVLFCLLPFFVFFFSFYFVLFNAIGWSKWHSIERTLSVLEEDPIPKYFTIRFVYCVIRMKEKQRYEETERDRDREKGRRKRDRREESDEHYGFEVLLVGVVNSSEHCDEYRSLLVIIILEIHKNKDLPCVITPWYFFVDGFKLLWAVVVAIYKYLLNSFSFSC